MPLVDVCSYALLLTSEDNVQEKGKKWVREVGNQPIFWTICASLLKPKVYPTTITLFLTIDRTKWSIDKHAWFGLTKNLNLAIKIEAAKQ